jgi:lysyl-tRNA synthetase class 2
MRYIIDDDILLKYTEVKIGVLVSRGVKIDSHDPNLADLQAKVITETREEIGSTPLTRLPFVRSWREMYRSFGTKPGDYRPSAEALLRRALRDRGMPGINTAVDAYNAASVRHIIPMGGFDLDRVQGAIRLRLSEGGEAFTPLGARETEETYVGEPVYADDARVLTRRWNFRDCDWTKITPETVNLVMFVDGSPEIPRESVEKAVGDLSSLLGTFCGGRSTSGIADKETPEVSL